MTEENIRKNIRVEWERAGQARGAADLLAKEGFLPDAVSRIYYWVFHCVRALLLSRELEPKTHEGTLRLFSLHFVKDGPLSPEQAHIFSRLMKYRLEADYAAAYVFTATDLEQMRSEAESLTNAIERLLSSGGWL